MEPRHETHTTVSDGPEGVTTGPPPVGLTGSLIILAVGCLAVLIVVWQLYRERHTGDDPGDEA